MTTPVGRKFRPTTPAFKPGTTLHKHKFVHMRRVLARLQDPLLLKPKTHATIRAALEMVRAL